MKPHTYIYSAMLAMLSATMAGCNVEIDTCLEETHPHQATASFVFGSSSAFPDSMYVVAYKIFDYKKTLLTVDTESGIGHYSARGRFAVSDPSIGFTEPTITPADTTAIDTTATDTTAADTTVQAEVQQQQAETADTTSLDTDTIPTGSFHDFPLTVGRYWFIALNKEDYELTYDGLADYMNAPIDGLGWRNIAVAYRQFERTDTLLRKLTSVWQDYNNYSKLIQPDIRPIFADSVIAVLNNHQHHNITFGLGAATQNIDIFFNIRKDTTNNAKFAVDSIIAEISGIPLRIELHSGYLDTDSTARMMFPMNTVGNSGTGRKTDTYYGETTFRAHGNINVTSIVANSSPTAVYGPGILQVAIFLHAQDPINPERTVKRKIQGKINLYNSLDDANLILHTSDGLHAKRTAPHGVININATVNINGEKIIEDEQSGGLDHWMATDNIIVDI